MFIEKSAQLLLRQNLSDWVAVILHVLLQILRNADVTSKFKIFTNNVRESK